MLFRKIYDISGDDGFLFTIPIILIIITWIIPHVDRHLAYIEIPIIYLIAATILLGELFFLKEKDRPGRGDGFWDFTIERKIVCIIDSGLTIMLIVSIANLANWIMVYFIKDLDTLFKLLLGALTWIGIGVAVVAVLAGYIYLNSFKYRKSK